MQATLPNGDIIIFKIESEETPNVTWFSLALSVGDEWQTIEGTSHLDLNKMFEDVSELIKDLENGRRVICTADAPPAIKRVRLKTLNRETEIEKC